MNLLHRKKDDFQKGFTLLELLIVIAIIAILSVILVLVINPAETLKKSRDAQRISDLNTLKTAVGLLLMSSSTPNLAQTSTDCLGASGANQAKIFYSYAGSMACTGTAPTAGGDAEGAFLNGGAGFCSSKTTSSAASAVDGTGWAPIDLTWLPGGSPISNFPLDPINTVANSATPTSTDLVYRYACKNAATAKPTNVFEINARLESDAYTVTDNKMTKDGGDNFLFYEVGTNLKLLPTTGGF